MDSCEKEFESAGQEARRLEAPTSKSEIKWWEHVT